MNDQIAIHVEHVQKEFRIYLDKGIYLKERFCSKNDADTKNARC